MAVQPWKPNHFLVDFTGIFVVVAILVCVATVMLHAVFTSAGIPIQGINFNTFILIFIITTLLTVVGRWIQIGRARRNNWVEEIPGSAPDPNAPPAYSEETKEEWKRLQQAHSEASLANSLREAEQVAETTIKRAAQIEYLEQHLAKLQQTKADAVLAPDTISPSETVTLKSRLSRSTPPEDIVL